MEITGCPGFTNNTEVPSSPLSVYEANISGPVLEPFIITSGISGSPPTLIFGVCFLCWCVCFLPFDLYFFFFDVPGMLVAEPPCSMSEKKSFNLSLILCCRSNASTLFLCSSTLAFHLGVVFATNTASAMKSSYFTREPSPPFSFFNEIPDLLPYVL